MAFHPEKIMNCDRCGVLFLPIISSLCPDCAQDDLEEFREMYRFISENPNRTLEEVALGTGIPLRRIEKIFYAGRMGTAATTVIIHCRRCGEEASFIMRKGRFCVNCAFKLMEEVQAGSWVTEEKPKDKGGKGKSSSKKSEALSEEASSADNTPKTTSTPNNGPSPIRKPAEATAQSTAGPIPLKSEPARTNSEQSGTSGRYGFRRLT